MPITQEEWASIETLVQDAFRKRGREITQGVVIERNEPERWVRVKEFGDVEIHVIGQNYQFYVMRGGIRELVELKPQVPKVGDSIIIITIGGWPKAISIHEYEAHPTPLIMT